MSSFLKKLIIFCVPIIIISWPLDNYLSQNTKKSNSFSGEYIIWNDIYNSDINANVVIYGSSKAWVSFNPAILEDILKCKVYNLGIDGHNFWLEYLRHKEFLKFNIKPDYIVLNLDQFSLEKRTELYNLDQFLPYMLFNKDIYTYTSSYQGFSWYDYYIPLIRYHGRREAILNAFFYSFNVVNTVPMREKGFRGMEFSWNDDFDHAKSLMSYYEVKIDSVSKDLFKRFLTECAEEGIRIIFVYSPEYIEFNSFVRNRNEIISLYSNYTNDTICSQKQYFYNATHLNKKGSELFTHQLARDLKQIIVHCQELP